MLPPPMQDSLPAGWMTFAGRELNPLDRDEFPSCYILFPLPWIYPDAMIAEPEGPSFISSTVTQRRLDRRCS
jgi:hypothetical protein